jgi:hypothetical protein
MMMKTAVRRYYLVFTALVVGLFLAKSYTAAGAVFPWAESISVTPRFPSQHHPSVTFNQTIIASPLVYPDRDKPLLIAPVSDGVIAMLDADTGALVREIPLPAPEGQQVELVATPVRVDEKLVVVYQCLDRGVRVSHRLSVIDMAGKKIDEAFPVLELSAEQPGMDTQTAVKFHPPTAYSHASLRHASKGNGELGFVYVSFGNAGDTQPFHGWLFEIDLDAWRKQGPKQAIASTLVTTPEAECPVTVESGTREMICGGGIWTPPGPQIYSSGDSYEILVPTGNGQLNLARRDYANTLMRLKPGLRFDPGCDERFCANFDPLNPDKACVESCKNLFIPRLGDRGEPLRPAGGECDNKSYLECLAWMDYDLGANAPVKATLQDGLSVLIQPGKDGSVFLLDAEHMGIQYDRQQIVEVCGTMDDPCKVSWMGMIVTQPALVDVDGTPVVVIPAFVPDSTHAAGLVALKIVRENGKPKFERFWQYPDPAGPEAKQRFRYHPSLPVVSKHGKNGEAIVWIIDVGEHGTIYGIRVRDGKLLAKVAMQGTGRPLSAPVIHNGSLYAASTLPATRQAILEGFNIEVTP